MSLKSWKEEFYSVPACNVTVKNSEDHVERKWHGLTIKNLRKHGLKRIKGNFISDGVSEFQIYASSCAWCKINNKRGGVSKYLFSHCHFCPAVKAGMGMCTDYDGCDHVETPWSNWSNLGRTKEMLDWIRRARKLIKKQGK